MVKEPVNVREVRYSRTSFGGHELIGTGYKVDLSSIPEGYYGYFLRGNDTAGNAMESHDDGSGEYNRIYNTLPNDQKIYVLKNPEEDIATGTIITKEPLDFAGKSELCMEEMTISYNDPTIRFDDFQDQEMSDDFEISM